VLQGGKFGHGFVAAGFTAAAGQYVRANVTSSAGKVVSQVIIGGTASELSGGRFSNGAATAAFQAMAMGIKSTFAAGRGPDTRHKPSANKSESVRALTTGEIAMAKEVYQDSIDYTKVLVHKGNFIPGQDENTYMTPKGEIYAPEKIYSADYSAESVGTQGVFIHEMAHVLQHQEGINVMWEGIKLGAGGGYMVSNINATYTPNWYSEYQTQNIEQQATLWEQQFIQRFPKGWSP